MSAEPAQRSGAEPVGHAEDDQEQGSGAGGTFWGSGRLAAALLVLAIVVAAGCGWLLWREQRAVSSVDGAITSTAARASGRAAATKLTRRALSYRWTSLARDLRAARAGMTDDFSRQYAAAMAKVRDQTLRNHVTVKAHVVASSVVSASEHQVRALLFVNQVTTTKASSRRRLDQNRVVVTLTRAAGDWQISQMRAF